MQTRKKTDHWIDIMPAIPLANGSRVIRPAIDIESWESSGTLLHPDVRPCIMVDDADERWVVCLDELRVNLDDPQGFGYALRLAVSMGVPPASLPVNAWIRSETTDADRLALAQALAELTYEWS